MPSDLTRIIRNLYVLLLDQQRVGRDLNAVAGRLRTLVDMADELSRDERVAGCGLHRPFKAAEGSCRQAAFKLLAATNAVESYLKNPPGAGAARPIGALGRQQPIGIEEIDIEEPSAVEVRETVGMLDDNRVPVTDVPGFLNLLQSPLVLAVIVTRLKRRRGGAPGRRG